MEKFFHLKENGTTVSTEVMAGLTTFFAMSYIIIVNPQILSQTGMPWGGVFLATIIAAIAGTLVMGLFAKYRSSLTRSSPFPKSRSISLLHSVTPCSIEYPARTAVCSPCNTSLK